MRYLFLIISAGFLLTNCAPTETTTAEQDIEVEEEPAEERFAPDWYEKEIDSATDSLTFSAFSYSIAEGDERAREQSRRTALSNLRFEIDRFVESVRADLEDEHGSDPFSTQQLIMNVRNAVQNLDLSDTDLEQEVKEENGLSHVFIKAQISREDVLERLAGSITNPILSESLRDQ